MEQNSTPQYSDNRGALVCDTVYELAIADSDRNNASSSAYKYTSNECELRV